MFRFEPNVVTLAVLAIREKIGNERAETYILKNGNLNKIGREV